MTILLIVIGVVVIICLGGIGTELEGIREELRGIKWRMKNE